MCMYVLVSSTLIQLDISKIVLMMTIPFHCLLDSYCRSQDWAPKSCKYVSNYFEVFRLLLLNINNLILSANSPVKLCSGWIEFLKNLQNVISLFTHFVLLWTNLQN